MRVALHAPACFVKTLCLHRFKNPVPAGNFLNAGNRNLAATGFQIETLVKLKDVRSTRARCASKPYSQRPFCSLGIYAPSFQANSMFVRSALTPPEPEASAQL